MVSEQTESDQTKSDQTEPTPGRKGAARLIVGFDRHDAGRRALRYAAALAGPLDASLVVVHVIAADDAPLDPDSPRWEEQVEAGVQAVREEAAATLSQTRADWTFQARRGAPAVVLSAVASAEGALMIVLGAPRAGLVSAMERMLGEAVSAQLLRHGRHPVLLVPEGGPPSVS